jgi:hypothetical protein
MPSAIKTTQVKRVAVDGREGGLWNLFITAEVPAMKREVRMAMVAQLPGMILAPSEPTWRSELRCGTCELVPSAWS